MVYTLNTLFDIYNVGRRKMKIFHLLVISINGIYDKTMDRIKTFCEQIGSFLCQFTYIGRKHTYLLYFIRLHISVSLCKMKMRIFVGYLYYMKIVKDIYGENDVK